VKKVNVTKLYTMQRELDAHIQSNHQLQQDNLIDKKILALLVEIGELANETRCFKFWSLKPPATKEKILEEFVDGVHFILSVGIECGFEDSKLEFENSHSQNLTDQFLSVYESVNKFKESHSFKNFEKLFSEYVSLAKLLGFNSYEIEQAYIQKNEVNYERQQNGY
jgi:dimeric dUTPase (all-alpha-NTP-PPase superfamily)